VKDIKAKAILKMAENSGEIVFPGLRNWPRIVLLIVAIVIGLIAGLIGLKGMTRADIVFGYGDVFMCVWIFIWIVFILLLFRNLFWNIFNMEIVLIYNDYIEIERQGMLLKEVKKYAISDIENIRIREENYDLKWMNSMLNLDLFSPSAGSTIRFDIGNNTVKFGSGIDEAEAYAIIQKLVDLQYLSHKNIWKSNAQAVQFES